MKKTGKAENIFKKYEEDKELKELKRLCKAKKTPDENCDDGIDKDKWRKLKEEQDYCTENTETQCIKNKN